MESFSMTTRSCPLLNYQCMNPKFQSGYSSFYTYAYIIPYLNIIFCQFCLQLVRSSHILNLSQCYHDIVDFMYDFYYGCVYMCSLYLYILLCNRAAWKNSVTEWFTLYKYIWNKKNTAQSPLRQWCWVEFYAASFMAGHGKWRIMACQLAA